MNDRPRLNQGGYDYTDAPTRYRIIREDYGDDERQWMLDGIDDERNYTEAVWFCETWEDAMAAVPEFAKVVPLSVCVGCGRSLAP